MKKIIAILCLILVSGPIFSESISDSLIRVSREKMKNIDIKKDIKNIDTIGRQIFSKETSDQKDSAFKKMNECKDILSKEIKQYGLKKTIQINSNLFLPLAIIIILTLIWLKSRKKV